MKSAFDVGRPTPEVRKKWLWKLEVALETVDALTLTRPQASWGRPPHRANHGRDRDLFIGIGYQVVEGQEVELNHYNFEMMNLPKTHPARDMQDTFYIISRVLLRTHTSQFKPGPWKNISVKDREDDFIGKVFRRDSDDATHQFTKLKG